MYSILNDSIFWFGVLMGGGAVATLMTAVCYYVIREERRINQEKLDEAQGVGYVQN